MLVKELIEKLKYPTQICVQYQQTKTCCCFESTLYKGEYQSIIESHGEKEVVCFDIMNDCGEHGFNNIGSYCLIIEI